MPSMLLFCKAMTPAVLALLLIVAPPLAAQRASPWLPSPHWSRAAITRLHAAGLVSLDPAAPPTLFDAGAALPDAYRARLVAELPLEAADTIAPTRRLVLAEAALLFVSHAGRLRPGRFSLERAWVEPQPVPDVHAAGVRLRAWSTPTRWLALTAEAAAGTAEVELEHGTVDVALGKLGAWAGRRSLGFTPADGGGLVLHSLPRFDGAGLRTVGTIHLPLTGPVSAEVFGGAVRRNGYVRRPVLFALRVHARPHPRLDLGATRAAVFGTMDSTRLRARDYLEVLIGANLAGTRADDQVAAIDGRWRPPLRAPVELFGEWGVHDADPGVLFDVPAFTAGLRLPFVALLSGAGLAVEHTRISAACCGNPPWYHHFELADGWTTNGRLLGHPLGGHGRQWRATVTADALRSAVQWQAALLRRTRATENLLASVRTGRSWAFEGSASALLGAHISVEIELFGERGTDWSETGGRLAVARRF